MVAHARAEAPNECCGLLAGRDGRVLQRYPVTNAEASPYRYNMESRELLRAMRDMDGQGWDLLGIYHSHTHTPAHPSPTDVSLAFYPESLYLLISLIDPGQPVVRAFRIVEGKISEAELVIE
jgi:proteasome lid subunit RPN8/RPN11